MRYYSQLMAVRDKLEVSTLIEICKVAVQLDEERPMTESNWFLNTQINGLISEIMHVLDLKKNWQDGFRYCINTIEQAYPNQTGIKNDKFTIQTICEGLKYEAMLASCDSDTTLYYNEYSWAADEIREYIQEKMLKIPKEEKLYHPLSWR